MKITLTELEQKMARYVAAKRQEVAEQKGLCPVIVGGRTDRTNLSIHLDGAGAEIAFARYANIYPALDVGHLYGDDFTLKDGRTVDVKSTALPHGRLMAKINKVHKQADIYALFIGEFPTYALMGFCSAEELFKPENIRDNGYGRAYFFPQHKLKTEI